MKRDSFINRCDNTEAKYYRKRNKKRNLNTQHLQFFINILLFNRQCQHNISDRKMYKRNRNETHCIERFQSASFSMK